MSDETNHHQQEPAAVSTPSPPKSAPPDPEVVASTRPKRYTTAYKLKVLEEAERCRAAQGLGAYLRREGLYSSTLRDFQRQRDRGLLGIPGTAPPDPPPSAPARTEALAREVAELRRQNRKLSRQLKQAQLGLEIATKACELLGLPLEEEEG